MKGDFSRLTFDSREHFQSVRMQQGRVLLDADWNEQIDIVNYHQETLLKHLFGSAGAPSASAGFQISLLEDLQASGSGPAEKHGQKEDPLPDFLIGSGHYYVDGILCENEQGQRFSGQPDLPRAVPPPDLKEYALIYLDAWPQHITALEDPALREVALGGIDTTTRVKTLWQVKILPIREHRELLEHEQDAYEHSIALPEWQDLLGKARHRARLSARHNPVADLENQLYRIEIHTVHKDTVTFKWSRENGSILFTVDEATEIANKDGVARYRIILGEQLKDKVQLSKGDWVEFIERSTMLEGRTLPLYQVVDLPDFADGQLILAGPSSTRLQELVEQKSNLLLRRWDHDLNRMQQEGVVRVQEDMWLDVELGIQVRFTQGGTYAVGDYWLIPARTLAGTIEWPADEHGPLELPPHGVVHHYCPLALLHLHRGQWAVANDLRRIFATLPVVTARMEKPRVPEALHTGSLIEECEAEEELAHGDLVSFVPSTRNSIVKTDAQNARLLLGVVTHKEREGRERHYHVTIYGRARCKITGSVGWGDLLTVSHHKGCARAVSSEHRTAQHGMLLGKALSAYEPDNEDDIGIIDVLVTLQ